MFRAQPPHFALKPARKLVRRDFLLLRQRGQPEIASFRSVLFEQLICQLHTSASISSKRVCSLAFARWMVFFTLASVMPSSWAISFSEYPVSYLSKQLAVSVGQGRDGVRNGRTFGQRVGFRHRVRVRDVLTQRNKRLALARTVQVNRRPSNYSNDERPRLWTPRLGNFVQNPDNLQKRLRCTTSSESCVSPKISLAR